MRLLGNLAKFWVLLAFSGSMGYFFLHNQDRMPLHLPPWIDHVSVPSWLAYGAAFLVGSLVTTMAFIFDAIGKSLEIRRLRKALKASRESSGGWDDGRSGPGDSLTTSRPASALSAMGSGVSPLS